MAKYPCAECGTMVDTNSSGNCPKCGSKKPFTCSKCGKHVALTNVYKPQTLTHRGKPLYCEDCGRDMQIVSCARCGRDVIRANGVEIPQEGKLVVYHRECLEEGNKLQKLLMPVFIIVGYILAAYLVHMSLGILWAALICGFVGAIGGYYLGKKVIK